MQDKFMLDLRHTFSAYSFDSMFSNELNLYVQEINALDTNNHKIKITKLTETEPSERHFKIVNPNNAKIEHICIDGDFIPFGQEKYDNHSLKHKDGRPDSLVFSEHILIFLELKVEQEDASFDKENTQWKKFFEGVTQVEDFLRFLRSNSIEVKNYFPTVKAVICMRFEPKLVSNTSRNTELLRRAMVLGFPIAPHNHTGYFNIN